METKMPSIPKIWSIRHLELETRGFTMDILDTLNQTDPSRKVRNEICPFRWWSAD